MKRALRELRLLAFLLALPVTSCADGVTGDPSTTAPVWTPQVLATYPHDSAAFTQGLVWADSVLIEGTGLRGQSTLRRVELATGAVLDGIQLDSQYFGEGVALVGDRIVQLTWTSNLGFVYDAASFDELATFSYPGEGWGLAYDAAGDQLVMSDGTATLRWLDPVTFAERDRVTVRDGGQPVYRLNELEFGGGSLYANVWPTNRIAQINPETGAVTAWIDCAGIRPAGLAPGAVLNGIAWDPAGQRFFVTGKLWPSLFAVEFAPPGR